MAEQNRRRSGRREKRRIRRIKIAVALGVAVLLACTYWLAALGPKQVSDTRMLEEPVQADKMREEVRNLIEQHETLESLRGADDEEAVARLGQAVERQRELIDILPFGGGADENALLEQLETKLQQILAAPIAEESLQAEQAARAALEAGDKQLAFRNLRAALLLQRQINSELGRSRHADRSREVRLEREHRELMAEPLYEARVQAEQEAQQLLEQGKLKEARVMFEKALSFQNELSAQYQDTRFAQTSQAKALEQRLAEIRGDMSLVGIDELLNEAKAAAETGEQAKAADLYTEAGRRQRLVNDTLPGTRAASPERLARIEKERQTALSTGIARRISANVNLLRENLKGQRGMAAAGLLASLDRDMSQLQQHFPLSDHNDEALQTEVRYLNMMRNKIPFLQEALLNHLQPLPGSPDLAMLNREVSQVLYETIVGGNPSGNRGDHLPVDSVTHAEAQEFSRKMSWILARTVRLPREEEFRAGVGEVRTSQMVDGSWNSSSVSDRISQPVASSPANTNGFHDLLGNVAEWLQAEAGSGEAITIGGSVRDNPVRLAQIPLESRPKEERNRFTGFRVVVELED